MKTSCQEIHDDDDDDDDDFQLMTAEKKARQEMEDMRQQLKKMQEAERRDRRKLAEDEALRKIKKMEETITELQKSLASQKQVSQHACTHRQIYVGKNADMPVELLCLFTHELSQQLQNHF